MRITTVREFSSIILSVLLILIAACTNGSDKKVPTIKTTAGAAERDPSITEQTAYTNLFLDSAMLEQYVSGETLPKDQREAFRDFYRQRNYQYAWFDSRGMGEQAPNFLNLNHSFIELFNATMLVNPKLDSTVEQFRNDSTHFDAANKNVAVTELELTAQFFRYAQIAYAGREDISTKDLGWFIPRRKIGFITSLDSLLQYNSSDPEAFEPMHPQYKMLKNYLLRYIDIEKKGGWQPIKADKKLYKKGDTSAIISLLKARLLITGDLFVSDTGTLFNDSLATAVARFQHRYGVKEDSTITPALIAEMNRPIQDRIRQIIINLERLRWVPDLLPSHYIVVNIPEYKFHMYDSSKLQWSMNVVVGSAAHNTVIFSGNLQYVVFSPYWNVPYSIVKNEMGRSASYFTKRNMEVVGKYGDGLPMVRQKPGENNALGRVKFLFPNQYSIYFHDTPSKNLFGRDKRAFSHGCIRLAEPAKLAKYLLQYDNRWTADSIAGAMKRNTELSVTLRQPIPVFIGYFTAWISENGQLNFRDDIYGHDKKMAEKLFSK
ncbi:MAG: L,D-transpeptidase family protein [Bacteroidota bacterium]